MTSKIPSATPSRQPQVGMWPRRRERQRSLLPQIIELVVIIGFIIGSYHAAFWYWQKTEPAEVSVPSVLGLTATEAEKILNTSGLRSEVVARKTSEETPEGAVLAAEPPPGRAVKEGRLVRLTLSSGSRWSVVPDVREMSVDRARALLRQEKLTIGNESARYHAQIPLGYVIGHAPQPEQRVPRGTSVDLVVSKGPAPKVVPLEENAGLRRTRVEYEVPPGASLQEIRIVVQDKNGERTVYRNFHRPGERVQETVSGDGPGAVVRVYLSGVLAQETPF
ncbi:MAG: PASTA domain-containing protein [Armatimonadetes bacterium]|nr:PASTA domain-containing protein [Armatimonadota bacterium]